MVLWTKHFTLEFIELLRSLECLWNMSHHNYQNPYAREVGYKTLAEKVREVDPGATVLDVKRKIKALRTNLKKVERRIIAYQKCSLNHKPSLFYYEPLSFLLNQERSHSAANELKRSKKMPRPQENKKVAMNEDSALTVSKEVRAVSNGDATKKRGIEMTNVSVKAHSDSNLNRKKKTTNIRDVMEAQVFGKYVATKLVSVSNLQRVYLEKIINDAIYEAELGNLTINSKLYKDYDGERFYVSLNDQQNVNEVVIEDIQSEENENSKISPATQLELQSINDKVYEVTHSNTECDKRLIEVKITNELLNDKDLESENQSISNSEIQNGVVYLNDVEIKKNCILKSVLQRASQDGNAEENVSFENVQFIDDSMVEREEDEAITIIYVEEGDASQHL